MPEQVFPAQPISTAAGRVIASPFQFVTSGEDNLRIAAANSLTGVTLAIQGRRMTAKGTVEAFAWTFTPSADRLVTSTLFPLGVGAVLNLTIFAATGTPQIGQTFVQAKLVRGFSGAIVVLGTILQGYVTSNQELAWPGSPIQSSIETGGYPRVVLGTNPALGAQLTETVPTGARWELQGFIAALTTSAVAGTRQPALVFDDGTFTYGIAVNPGTLAPSSTISFVWQPGVPSAPSGGGFAPLGNLAVPVVMLAGHRMRSSSNNFDAGDQWDQVHYLVREWLQVL